MPEALLEKVLGESRARLLKDALDIARGDRELEASASTPNVGSLGRLAMAVSTSRRRAALIPRLISDPVHL